MKNYRKIKKAIKARLDEETEICENWETESAPSGEWAEYNIDYIAQEHTVYAWEEAYDIIKGLK